MFPVRVSYVFSSSFCAVSFVNLCVCVSARVHSPLSYPVIVWYPWIDSCCVREGGGSRPCTVRGGGRRDGNLTLHAVRGRGAGCRLCLCWRI
jgi:hypothetical protein